MGGPTNYFVTPNSSWGWVRLRLTKKYICPYCLPLPEEHLAVQHHALPVPQLHHSVVYTIKVNCWKSQLYLTQEINPGNYVTIQHIYTNAEQQKDKHLFKKLSFVLSQIGCEVEWGKRSDCWERKLIIYVEDTLFVRPHWVPHIFCWQISHQNISKY